MGNIATAVRTNLRVTGQLIPVPWLSTGTVLAKGHCSQNASDMFLRAAGAANKNKTSKHLLWTEHVGKGSQISKAPVCKCKGMVLCVECWLWTLPCCLLFLTAGLSSPFAASVGGLFLFLSWESGATWYKKLIRDSEMWYEYEYSQIIETIRRRTRLTS